MAELLDPGRDYSVDPLSAPWELSAGDEYEAASAERSSGGGARGQNPGAEPKRLGGGPSDSHGLSGRIDEGTPRSRRNGMGGAVNQ